VLLVERRRERVAEVQVGRVEAVDQRLGLEREPRALRGRRAW